MYIIQGNYGDPTIALIQWAHEQSLTAVHVVSVDTGWQAQGWQDRVNQGEALARSYGFNVIRLAGNPSFSKLMRDRHEFPSVKFQWCAGFLKGLPLIDWLDEIDPSCESTIMLGKKRIDSRIQGDLAEYIPASEHYGDRKVWFPLYAQTRADFYALIDRSGLPALHHRSLECDPCVNSCSADLLRLHPTDIAKTAALEQELNKTLFTAPIAIAVQTAQTMQLENKNSAEQFDMGCGAPFGCGE